MVVGSQTLSTSTLKTNQIICILNFVDSTTIKSYENLWIVGDEFVENTSAAHFTESKAEFAIKDKFNTYVFSSDRHTQGNILNRVYNNMIRAIGEHHLMPKLIVMIIDSDVSKNIHGPAKYTEKMIELNIKHMITDIHDLIMEHKRKMPSKALKYKYPTVLWITPPSHDNFIDNSSRNLTKEVIQSAVMQYNEMRFMNLKHWSPSDESLVTETYTGYRFTGKGLGKYWSAVDKAILQWCDKQEQYTHKSYNFFKQKKTQYKK